MASSPEPPPTRQLFVRLLARRARDTQEVEDVFSRYGALKFCQLGRKHDLAFVHYWSTRDAIDAKQAVDGALIFGLSLAVDFNRVYPLVKVDNYPPYLSR